MKKTILITFLLVFATMCYGQKSKDNKDVVKNIKLNKNELKVEVQTKKFEEKYHLFNDKKNPTCSIEIHYLIFNEQNQENIRKLQKQFAKDFLGGEYKDEDITKNIKAYSNNCFKEYKEIEKELKENKENPLERNEWTYEFKSQLVFNKNGICGIKIDHYEYTGGAHPNHGTFYLVYDINKGERMTLKDIFKSGYEKSLTDIILNYLKTNFKNGEINFDDVKITDNFIIYDNHILFHYNPYEIACYAVGDIEVKLTFNELKSILSEKSILSSLITK